MSRELSEGQLAIGFHFPIADQGGIEIWRKRGELRQRLHLQRDFRIARGENGEHSAIVLAEAPTAGDYIEIVGRTRLVRPRINKRVRVPDLDAELGSVWMAMQELRRDLRQVQSEILTRYAPKSDAENLESALAMTNATVASQRALVGHLRKEQRIVQTALKRLKGAVEPPSWVPRHEGSAATLCLNFAQGHYWAHSLLSLEEAVRVYRSSEAWHLDAAGRWHQAHRNEPRIGRIGPDTIARLICEDERVNRICFRNDLAGEAWVPSGCVVKLAATHPNGGVASASRIWVTEAGATLMQTLKHPVFEHVFSCYIRRVAGEGPVWLTADGGATWEERAVASKAWHPIETAPQLIANATAGFKFAAADDVFEIAWVQYENGPNRTTPIDFGRRETIARRSAEQIFVLPPLPLYLPSHAKATVRLRALTTTLVKQGTFCVFDASGGHAHGAEHREGVVFNYRGPSVEEPHFAYQCGITVRLRDAKQGFDPRGRKMSANEAHVMAGTFDMLTGQGSVSLDGAPERQIDFGGKAWPHGRLNALRLLAEQFNGGAINGGLEEIAVWPMHRRGHMTELSHL